MMRSEMQHTFVEFVPAELEEGVVYVSVEYGTASHLCCCGCGERVVTPITPTDWKIIFNGEAVSLHPSIGNWSFECRSHYFIKEDKVVWAGDMSDEKVAGVRQADVKNKAEYFETKSAKQQNGIFGWFKRWFK